MSGPKDGCVTLAENEKRRREEERRKKLEEEKRRRLEEREKIMLEDEISKAKANLKRRVSELCFEADELIKKGDKILKDSKSLVNMKNSIEHLQNTFRKLINQRYIREISFQQKYLQSLEKNEDLELSIKDFLKTYLELSREIESFAIGSYNNKLKGLSFNKIFTKGEGFNKELEDNKKLSEEYINKYIEYGLLCEKLGMVNSYSEHIPLDRLKSTILDIEKDIEILKSKLDKEEDYKYIADSISEVMEELGYNIISSEIMSLVNRDVVDNIYKFDDSNVVNVFTSNNGTVMFEVTGISNERKELTSMDKLKIKESMDKFCSDYDVIKEKLAERGIIFTRENLRPADEKYSKIRVVSPEKLMITKANKNVIKDKLIRGEVYEGN